MLHNAQDKIQLNQQNENYNSDHFIVRFYWY